MKDLKITEKLMTSDYLIIKKGKKLIYDGLTALVPMIIFKNLEIKKAIRNEACNLILIAR